jgi:nucleoside-diphosphate-sugar epimerase
MSDAPILVTGATGYIAGHAIQQLLAAGHRVRGTVRDLAATDRVAHLRAMTDREDALEFVPADLTEDAGWAQAVLGCEYVLHMASPLPIDDPKDPMELIRPARDGARRVLRACTDAGVKRLVFTSSTAAVVDDRVDHVFTGDDWAPESLGGPYKRSKTIGERALWALHAELAPHERPELVTICPCLVVGPVQNGRRNTSIEPVRRLLAGAIPAIPHLSWNVVDVRDVAGAHVAALTAPNAADRRYLLSAGNRWMMDIAKNLAADFEGRASVPTRAAPGWLLWVMSFWDGAAARVVGDLGKQVRMDASAAKSDLGFDPIAPELSVRECAESLLAHGIV